MNHFIRFAAPAAAAVCAAVLAGCETTAPQSTAASQQTAEKVPASRFDDGTYGFMHSSVPSIKGARPLGTVTTLQAFQGDGVYYFNDKEESSFRIGKADSMGRYQVTETYSKGQKAHGFAWGTNVKSLVRNGAAISAEFPAYLTADADGAVRLYSDTSSAPVVMRVKLFAFDVSGEYIYHYLRDRQNYPTATAGTTTAKFPKGSIAYMPQISLVSDAYAVLNPNAFTGAGSVEGFARNFSKDIPYCLSYLPREGYAAYGVKFDPATVPSASGAKTEYKTVTRTRTVKNKKGKLVKQTYKERVAVVTESSKLPESGKVSLMNVKTGTVFCQASSATPAATGTYTVRTADGTRGMAMDFPASVKAPDTGIFELSRNAVSIALVEMKKNSSTSVVPGFFVKANQPITDFQYRFNKTAADAVRAELKK